MIPIQVEVDHLWEKLSEGGEEGQCGWLTDRFGVFWQIFPTAAEKLLQGEDEARAQRVMQALLSMTKIDLAGLERAYHAENQLLTKYQHALVASQYFWGILLLSA